MSLAARRSLVLLDNSDNRLFFGLAHAESKPTAPGASALAVR